MSKRSRLPGADELFRSTGTGPSGPDASPAADVVEAPPAELESRPAAVVPAAGEDLPELSTRAVAAPARARRRPRPPVDRRPTGRERHDEKITVYISPDELLDLEHARLTLRGDHGLAVDRGRIVREALAVVLSDFDTKGEASILVRRLRGQ